MSGHQHRMGWSRRAFLRAAGMAAGVGALPGCGSGEAVPHSPVAFQPGRPLPWINWSGNQSCTPAMRAAPATEAELVDALRRARGVVRAVGASHSFSAVVPTDGTLIATDLLSGLVAHDPATLSAEIWAGTRMHALGPLLHGIGQALPNMPDMDYPAMGGAIVNSVHGTGQRHGSLSSRVTGLTLATPSGELIECSTTRNREIFQAARGSVGALGIISRMTMQNVAPFRLVETTKVERTEDVLAELEQRCRAHRHFEFLPLPHSTLAVTVATDEAGPHDVAAGEDDPQAVQSLRSLWRAVGWMPGVGEAAYDQLLATFMAGAGNQVRVGQSYDVFPHIRVVRFREMEYTVPAEAGPQCVREILRTIRQRRLPIAFPLEYRYVKADDIWLSMFEGRDGCSISVHQYGDTDHRAYFAEIEPIFWKYQGRPHWGKLHTLNAGRLAALYPRHWQDFQQLRRSLDPQGRMLNPHLKQLFGV